MTTTNDGTTAATPDPRLPSYEEAIAALRAIGAVFHIGLWQSPECTERIVEAVRHSESCHNDTMRAFSAMVHERDEARRYAGKVSWALKAAGAPRLSPRPIRGGPMPEAERRALGDVVRCAATLVRAANGVLDEDPEALGVQLDALDRAQLRLWATYAESNAQAARPLEVHLPANPYTMVIEPAADIPVIGADPAAGV